MKKHDYKIHSMFIEYRNISGELIKELAHSVIVKQQGNGLYVVIPREGYSILARDLNEAESIAKALEKGKKK